MAIEFKGRVIQLPPKEFVVHALEWALWKAEHGEWEHVRDILVNIPAPLRTILSEEARHEARLPYLSP